QAHDCPTCPLKAECTTAEYRRIQISPLLRRYKQEVRERFKVPEVMATVKRRGVEVESVWGHIKEDRQFRRFLLRGLAKV
ncbi:transposase, partial [Sulfobacillus harzensis]|nr:IS5/IS1182 family transposase [Sulfobacillus harzensis]